MGVEKRNGAEWGFGGGLKSGELRGECPAERDCMVEYEAYSSSDIEPFTSSEYERLLLVSAAAERERERSFVVLGFLESDALEAAESTLRSESARWSGWSAASMTVVGTFRCERACGRGWKANGRGVGCCGSFNTHADRVARRARHVTTAGHAFPSIMSALDTGELATASRGFLLSRRGAVMSYLPQTEGWLPKWQLIVAVMAFFNAAQNFATLKLTRRIYGNVAPPLGSKSHATHLVTAFVDEGSFCIQ